MADHSSTVLFLGAGASKPFGYPLTKEILIHILSRLKEGKLFKDVLYTQTADFLGISDTSTSSSSFNAAHITAFPITLETRSQQELQRSFRQWLDVLYPGLKRVADELPEKLDSWQKMSDELPGITDVMSLVDYLVDHEEALSPRFQPKFLFELRSLLERAIMEVLEEPIDSNTFQNKKAELAKLANWINQQPPGSFTIITTNYDTLLETVIYEQYRHASNSNQMLAKSIDFGIVWRDPYSDEMHYPIQAAKLRIYKLHGSLNWLKCQLCGHNYINTYTRIYERAYDRQISEANSCHCLHSPLRPVIVAPSMVRDIRDTNLLSIWQRALEALRMADRWIFSGYSLPNEDLAIRSILMKADRAHHSTKKVEVYQHDEKEKSRYEMMFPGCQYQTGGIEKLIDGLPKQNGVNN